MTAAALCALCAAELVGDALLETVFDAEESDGAGLVIDGFPRTALQVDLLKLLYDKMVELHVQHADGPDEWRFPRPSFKVRPSCLSVCLYVFVSSRLYKAHGRAGRPRRFSAPNARVVAPRRLWCCTLARRRVYGAR
jgi:adenylate kinase family enzyme